MSDWDVGDTDDPETFHRVLAEQMRDELHDAGLDDPHAPDWDEDDPARPSLLWELAAFAAILAVVALLGVLNAVFG